MPVSEERIHIVTTCHNARPFVERTLASIRDQTWPNLSVMVIDDASSDGTASFLQHASRDDPRIRVRVLKRRVWAARARKLALDALDARPEQIVVLVDGDDWLSSPTSLETIHRFHHERRLLAAYGNHVTTDGQPCPWGRDYPLAAKITNAYRSVGWLAAHPRSFRYGLWSHVESRALRDRHQRYRRCATDVALFLPILELAGMRTGFLSEPLYVYNRETPLNIDKVDREGQRRAALDVLSQPPHEPLSPARQAQLLG